MSTKSSDFPFWSARTPNAVGVFAGENGRLCL
jgi:hypothetical protein